MDIDAAWDELVRMRGTAGLGRPFLPVPEAPPHPPEPSLVRLRELLHTALWWAGMHEHPIQLIDVRPPLTDHVDWRTIEPAVELVALEEGRLVFQVERLACDDVLLAMLAHEVARAWLALGSASAPYRSGDVLAQWSEDDETKAGVASVYLGFGLLIASAGRAFHQTGEIVGRSTVTRRQQFMIGSLPGNEMARLIALRLAARGSEVAEIEQTLARLDDTPADEVRKALVELPAGTAPAAMSTQIPPLPDAARTELVELEERYRYPHRGEHVPRYFERKTLIWAIIGAVLTAVPTVLLVASQKLWGIGIAIAGTLGGALLGRSRRQDYCGACMMTLRHGEATCPKCGATLGDPIPLSARVTRVSADDVEDVADDDELTKQALAAGKPEDAA